MSLRILRLAAGTTWQDRGRPGWRRYGVPPGGAFDRGSYELALGLVGRREGEALEIPIPGGEFLVTHEDRLAIVGGGLNADLDGTALPVNSAFDVLPGSKLALNPSETGLRVYLASMGGWKVNRLLESVSGVLPGTELHSAGLLSERPSPLSVKELESLRPGPIRFVRGPHGREIDLAAMLAGQFKVSLNSNRVGIRLDGGNFQPAQELPSEPSCVGVVQLAPSGELLIHGPDGPTVAGYPKIAVVIDADIDRLAQLRPLQDVLFEEVTLEDARRLSRARIERLGRIKTGIEPAPKQGWLPSSNQ